MVKVQTYSRGLALIQGGHNQRSLVKTIIANSRVGVPVVGGGGGG